MKPLLTHAQGHLIRALAAIVSRAASPVVEAATVRDWASLTFVGERHHLVLRFPGSTAVVEIDGNALAIPSRIVAVESCHWAAAADATVLTVDLLALKDE